MSPVPRVVAHPQVPEELALLVEALGMNRPALAILLALNDDRPASVGTISDRSGVGASNLSVQLPRLERLGFIEANVPREHRKGSRIVTWTLRRPAIDAALRLLRDQIGNPSDL